MAPSRLVENSCLGILFGCDTKWFVTSQSPYCFLFQKDEPKLCKRKIACRLSSVFSGHVASIAKRFVSSYSADIQFYDKNIFEKYIWNTSIRCPTNRAKATHLITINVKNKYKFPKRNISLNWIIQLSCIHFTILLIILFCIIVVNIEKNLRHRRPQTACVSSVWLSKY